MIEIDIEDLDEQKREVDEQVCTFVCRTGVRLRAACLGLVYKKLMRMSSLGNKSIGEVSRKLSIKFMPF